MKNKLLVGLSALTIFSLPIAGMSATLSLSSTVEWTFSHDVSSSFSGGSEIVARDSSSGNFWVTGSNGIDILSSSGSLVSGIDTSSYGSVNSVAIRDGIAAVAIAAPNITDPGRVVFYNTANGAEINQVTVGANPDMVKFTSDGRLLVANEGEADNGIDPEGSISIIDPNNSYSVNTAGFTNYNGQEDYLRRQGVRIFPGVDAAADLEPEYIAVSGDMAYVTLQENNSLAIVNLNTNKVIDVVSLGTKDHSIPGNGMDTNDKDGVVDISTKNVRGMYMPDAIDAYEANDGNTYLVTANEGDARGEAERVKDVTNIDSSVDTTGLERLQISTIDGDTDGDGDIDVLHSYGARSFSIWDEGGNLVWDSGDAIEQLLASEHPELLDDGRSDNKGPEPEGVTLLDVGDHTLAFIGLERSDATMAWDITDPEKPYFLDWILRSGDEAPEGLLAFMDEIGNFWLAVANEGTSTTTLHQLNIQAVPLPGAVWLMVSGLLGLAVSRQPKQVN
jgi:YVTN family beta-propeller protein